ncbi:hypothetical protein CTEN210_08404 [Chaetoceros tenuissimus]|uniref:ER membrane protein complex subunit 4 n=1 Tax=Chaetoceros tenuissimus TaxID=426638 RepID=A0AAD3CTZ1_9STRA|nr:hypothetical protein CTEN210_08404 [Chaetoceros tenuissimus]
MSRSAIKKWSLDLNVKDSDVGVPETKLPLPLGMKRVAKIESQLTTSASKSNSQSELSAKEKQRAAAIIKKKSSAAMGLATSPAKSVLMQSFMMYMTGSNLNMMSISVTSMSILNPLKAILGINKQFAKFEDASGKVELQMPKLIFTLLNLVWLAVGLYKMSKMRLLPTTSADWSGRIVWKELMESTSIPPM